MCETMLRSFSNMSDLRDCFESDIDWRLSYVRFSNRPFEVKHFQTIHHCSVDVAHGLALLFSNRPFEVKHFQTIHHCSVDVAHGLALLFGIGTKALPLWDSRTRRNNLWVRLAVPPTAGPSRH